MSQLDAWEKRFSDAKGFIQDFFKIGNLLYFKGRLADALTAYEKLYALLNRRVQEGRSELANDLAMALMNKGNALSDLGKLAEAIGIYDEAIGMYRQLVEAGRSELANDLARALINKAIALESLKDWDNALAHYKEGIDWQAMSVDAGLTHLLPQLIQYIRYRMMLLLELKRWDEAAQDVLQACDRIQPWLQAGTLPEPSAQEMSAIRAQIDALAADEQQEVYKRLGKCAEVLRGL